MKEKTTIVTKAFEGICVVLVDSLLIETFIVEVFRDDLGIENIVVSLIVDSNDTLIGSLNDVSLFHNLASNLVNELMVLRNEELLPVTKYLIERIIEQTVPQLENQLYWRSFALS
jgi:hypothetical protein